MRFLIVLLLFIFPLRSSYAEDFISTMKAVEDISVGPSQKDYFHTSKSNSFTIAKGEYFYSLYTCQPYGSYGCVREDDDYSCLIRYKGKDYGITNCVWLMDGYARNPTNDYKFRFIKTRPSNGSNIKLDH